MYKFAYVAVIGKPNAGKSTLINAIIGEKVAIVSNKPQTTRNNILGIKNAEDYQLVFVDTPGIHKTRNALDKYMMKNVRTAISGSEIILYLHDCTKNLTEVDINYIKNLKEKNQSKVIVALSKIDIIAREKVLPMIAKLSQIDGIDDIIPVSSKKNLNIDETLEILLKNIEPCEYKNFDFEEDDYTDKSLKFLASEIVREKTLFYLEDELPHGIMVVITKFEETDRICNIDADIICERDSHKSIVIGKGGSLIKQIGEEARRDIENLTGGKVMLKLFVKVKKDWRQSVASVNSFGYNDDLM